jgi:aryl-alcohol dehydrogenase-like predicted oxidoreductase
MQHRDALSSSSFSRNDRLLSRAIPLRRLGKSDLLVPRLCFGTMLFGESTSRPEASRLLDECMEHGVNFFDSAEMYPVPQSAESQGLSETILGDWLKSKPRQVQSR